MACCSEKRARWGRFATPSRPATAVSAQAPAAPARGLASAQAVTFEYVGKTGLSVLGPITHTRYRFHGPGAQLSVDNRDAPFVSGVPNLRRVREAGRT